MAINLGFNYPQAAREAGFQIHMCNDGPMDWRILGSIKIEQILEEQDLHKIDNILHHLSETPLGSVLESNVLEYNILKYFLVSQFAIQYLLFCRSFLEETVSEVKAAHSESQTEIVTLRKSIAESKNEVYRLKKKISEVEKAPETIYPCYVCSKNFVSNDSLNKHIDRRHPGSGDRSVSSEKRSESSFIVREREKDFTLINTIKLELEIKQLKERLNAAEKEIKERSSSHSKLSTPRQFGGKVTKDIGIQIDLDEQKEQDDCMAVESPPCKNETLIQLSNKVREFEIWRDKLRTDYEKFIIDINKKFELLAKTLEGSQYPQARDQQPMDNLNVNRMIDLENLLVEKVTEIGISSAKKLEEVVQRMEENYKQKLYDLEREIKSRSIDSFILAGADSNTSFCKDIGKRNSTGTFTVSVGEAEYLNNNESLEAPLPLESEKVDVSCAKAISAQNEAKPRSSTDSSCDNLVKIRHPTKLSESYTKITVSNSSSQDNSLTITEDEKPTSTPKSLTKPLPSKNKPPRKINMRVEAKSLANKELKKIGVSLQTKIISRSRMKRICTQLADKRNNLKEKYPHIHEMRNKIKKIVEKLCDADLPDDAKVLMNNVGNKNAEASAIPKDNEICLSSDTEKVTPTHLKAADSGCIETPTSLYPYDDGPSTSAEAMRKSSKSRQTSSPVVRKKVMFHTPHNNYSAKNNDSN